MTPFHIAIFYLACVIIGVLVGYHVAAYERRRRQKVPPFGVSLDRTLVSSSAFRQAWAGMDLPGASSRTMAEMETLLFRERAWPSSSKREYETPMYRPDLGVIPGGRIVESVTFAERVKNAAERKFQSQWDLAGLGQTRDNERAQHQGRQTTLWDIIPAPADLNQPAVG